MAPVDSKQAYREPCDNYKTLIITYMYILLKYNRLTFFTFFFNRTYNRQFLEGEREVGG